MHELSIAKSIYEIAAETAHGNGAGLVLAVRCRVGVMRQIVPALLKSAFQAVTDGTELAGAVLQIEAEPIRIHCAACGGVTESAEVLAACPGCGSARIRFSGGMDMQVTSISCEDKESSDEHPRAAECA
jgi:hydrogenase nickel incorporation protein HypA/HybF